jgi:hypothetical protein
MNFHELRNLLNRPEVRILAIENGSLLFGFIWTVFKDAGRSAIPGDELRSLPTSYSTSAGKMNLKRMSEVASRHWFADKGCSPLVPFSDGHSSFSSVRIFSLLHHAPIRWQRGVAPIGEVCGKSQAQRQFGCYPVTPLRHCGRPRVCIGRLIFWRTAVGWQLHGIRDFLHT